MENERKLKLISIMKSMGIESISDIKDSEDSVSNDRTFNNRLRIQKIVFFLSRNKLDRDSTYPYSIYLRGPYSPLLAKDYFSITDDEFNKSEIVIDEKIKETLEKLKDKSLLWLETASTLMSLMDAGYNDKEAIKRVMELKEAILKEEEKDHNYVKQVSEEIKDMRL
jgi:uncharacterized protein YwgA